MLTAEKAAIQPARAMVAARTYCLPDSQVFVVQCAVSLQGLHVGMYVSTPFRHNIRHLTLNFLLATRHVFVL